MGLNTIVLLDDDENDVDLFIKQFRNFNILNTIKSFLSPTDFKEYISGLTSDDLPLMIFIDIQLAGQSGLLLVKELREMELTKEVVIIVLTGLTDENTIVNALDSGADAFLLKPLKDENIIDFMRKFNLSIYLSDEKADE